MKNPLTISLLITKLSISPKYSRKDGGSKFMKTYHIVGQFHFAFIFCLGFPKSFLDPSMARFTSAVERTFVTCSAPNITGGKIHRLRHCLHWRPKRFTLFIGLYRRSVKIILYSQASLLNTCVILKQTE
jgi:hypothetical protein